MRGEATPSQGKEIYILQPRNIKKKTHVNFLSIRGPSKKKKLNISLHIEGFIFRINQSLLAYLYFLKTVSTLQLNIYCSIFSHVHIPEFQCSVESLRICISLLNYKYYTKQKKMSE